MKIVSYYDESKAFSGFRCSSAADPQIIRSVRPPLREAPRKPRCALMDDDDAARGDADDATAAAGGGGGGDDDAVAPEDVVEADVAASVEQDGAGDGGGAGAGAGGAGSARGVGGL